MLPESKQFLALQATSSLNTCHLYALGPSCHPDCVRANLSKLKGSKKERKDPDTSVPGHGASRRSYLNRGPLSPSPAALIHGFRRTLRVPLKILGLKRIGRA